FHSARRIFAFTVSFGSSARNPVDLSCFLQGSGFVLRAGELLAVDGQPYFKSGFKFNFAAMTVADYAVADDQAKAGAGADGLCGEEWLEHARLDLGRNAGAVVHDFDDDLIVFTRSADTDLALTSHSIDRVINQIGPNLI